MSRQSGTGANRILPLRSYKDSLAGGDANDPLTWIPFKQHMWWLLGRQYLKLLDFRARNIDTLRGIERSSVDFCASTRSLYRQFRNNEIRNGKQETTDLPDF